MNVELPSTGCNVISSATSFYNYSPDARTRQNWVIYEGVAHLQSSSYSNTGYAYTGTCLHTGDLVFHPEVGVYFPAIAIGLIAMAFLLIYHVIIKRLAP